MDNAINSKLILPVGLINYAYQNNLIKPLGIHTYLRFFTDGKIHKDSSKLLEMRKVLALVDNRTFKKYMQKALAENWIGFSAISGIYFIRSIKSIRVQNNIKNRQASIIIPTDLNNFRIYLASTLISKEVTDQKFYWEVVQKGRLKKATDKMAVAKHSEVAPTTPKPAYYGLSNQKITKLLNCKLSRASKLKALAAKAGYLSFGHKYQDLYSSKNPDFKIRATLYEQEPSLKGKIRCFPKKNKEGEIFYKFVIQLHDEIVPLVQFKRMEKLCHLKLPNPVLPGIQKFSCKAA